MLTPVLYQGWCLSFLIWDFPGSWRWVIFYWKLDILSIMFWILFKSCFSRPSVTGEGRATHYYQLGVETQVLYLALTDSQSGERERHLDITGLGWEFRLPTRPLLTPPWYCTFHRAPQTWASQSSLHLSETSYVYIVSRVFSCMMQEG